MEIKKIKKELWNVNWLAEIRQRENEKGGIEEKHDKVKVENSIKHEFLIEWFWFGWRALWSQQFWKELFPTSSFALHDKENTPTQHFCFNNGELWKTYSAHQNISAIEEILDDNYVTPIILINLEWDVDLPQLSW